MTPPLAWDVVEEHWRQAVFLWGQWERALVSPHYTLAELAARDEPRLLANFDGLLVAGKAASEQLLGPALQEPDAPGQTPAAYALLARDQPEHHALVLEALRSGDGPTQAAITRALQLCERPELGKALRVMEMNAPDELRAVARSVLAFHERAGRGPYLEVATDDAPQLVIATLEAIRVEPHEGDHPLVVAALRSDDPAVRNEAIVTGITLDLEPAWAACRELVRTRDDTAEAALLCLAVAGPTGDQESLEAALASPSLRGPALWALGCAGRPSGVEAALPFLGDADVARLAGEAVVAITGLPTAEMTMAAGDEESSAPPAGPGLEMSPSAQGRRPEDTLPLLAADRVEQWWSTHASALDPEQRYLLGQPHERASLLDALRHGPMRRRPPLALELLLRSGGRERVPTTAMTARQLRQLASLS